MLASVFLAACTTNDEPEEQAPTNSVVSDEPLETDAAYAEDDDITSDESSEEILDGHEEETVNDVDIGEVPEEKSDF